MILLPPSVTIFPRTHTESKAHSGLSPASGECRITKSGTEGSVARFRAFDVPDGDPHQVGYVLGTELLHNVVAVKLYSARADIERPGCFLGGGAAHDLSENYSLARGQ